MRTVRRSGRLSCHARPPPPLPRMPPFATHAPPLCHAHRSPPPPRGQTDACENIIFPQLLLRTVKRIPLYKEPMRLLTLDEVMGHTEAKYWTRYKCCPGRKCRPLP